MDVIKFLITGVLITMILNGCNRHLEKQTGALASFQRSSLFFDESVAQAWKGTAGMANGKGLALVRSQVAELDLATEELANQFGQSSELNTFLTASQSLKTIADMLERDTIPFPELSSARNRYLEARSLLFKRHYQRWY